MKKKNVVIIAVVLLICCLVSAAITALLLGAGVFGISNVQTSARDTQRITSLNVINLELEAFKGQTGKYPTNAEVRLTTDGTGIYVGQKLINLSGAAVANLNGTTTQSSDYCYEGYGDNYRFSVKLENGKVESFGDGVACNINAPTL